MDEQKQEKLRAIEDLITRDITELTEFVGELDKVQISLLAEHLMDLEYAVETIVHMMKEPSRPEVVDTRSRRWE